MELFKRRLFIAKAERVDTKQLEMEFAEKLRELDAVAGTLGIAADSHARDNAAENDDVKARDGKKRGKRKNNRGTGRRDLRELPLEEERIEISDPHLEKLVEEGKVVRHGFDDSYKLAHKRGGKRRVVIARVRYKAVDAQGHTDVITAPVPTEMLPGAIATPSLAAHVIMENVGKGMPLFRIEDSFARDGDGPQSQDDIAADGCTRTEVGCWQHCRKGYWEAAVSKSAVGREGLARIGRIFELDASWRNKPPVERKRLRDVHLRPHIESFFAWVDEQRPLFKDQRGYVRSALEYTHNQREALLRFLEDGKLVLTNKSR